VGAAAADRDRAGVPEKCADLLLDEPTSALDPTTEAAIMETIKELMKGRTTLIITPSDRDGA